MTFIRAAHMSLFDPAFFFNLALSPPHVLLPEVSIHKSHKEYYGLCCRCSSRTPAGPLYVSYSIHLATSSVLYELYSEIDFLIDFLFFLFPRVVAKSKKKRSKRKKKPMMKLINDIFFRVHT